MYSPVKSVLRLAPSTIKTMLTWKWWSSPVETRLYPPLSQDHCKNSQRAAHCYGIHTIRSQMVCDGTTDHHPLKLVNKNQAYWTDSQLKDFSFVRVTTSHRSSYPLAILADNLPRRLLPRYTGDAIERNFCPGVEWFPTFIELLAIFVHQRTMNLTRWPTIPTIILILRRSYVVAVQNNNRTAIVISRLPGSNVSTIDGFGCQWSKSTIFKLKRKHYTTYKPRTHR